MIGNKNFVTCLFNDWDVCMILSAGIFNLLRLDFDRSLSDTQTAVLSEQSSVTTDMKKYCD